MECKGILIAALASRENPPTRGGWSPWENLFMSSFQELCECKSHFLLGWEVTLWTDVLQCGKGECSRFAWEWFPSFLLSAYEAFESSCHHLAACADQPADWDNILQSAWALWDPQRILWWALSPSAAVESPATCWGPVPKAGESAAITKGVGAPHPSHRGWGFPLVTAETTGIKVCGWNRWEVSHLLTLPLQWRPYSKKTVLSLSLIKDCSKLWW